MTPRLSRPAKAERAARVFAAVLMAGLGGVSAEAQIRTELVASGFSQPVAFVQDPSDPTVQLVVEQGGRIRALKSGAVQATDFLDLRSVVRSSGEQGLLGLAFAPDYATSGRVYVNFTNLSGHTVIARFRRSATDPLRADAATRFDFRWPDGQRVITQPFSNHNGGHLAFGPDRFLYIGLGDGGSSNDPFHHAQNPASLLGKMLRLDVSVGDGDPEGYDVPPTNPFVGQPGVLGEIWSFGLRNPWRYAFDDPARGGSGALVLGDVGQNAWEEIDYEPAGRGGRNYGWRNREGAHANVTGLPPFSQPLVDPVFEYSHGEGRSVTGGVVYRGGRLGASFRGRYLFADFVRNRVWSIRLTVSGAAGDATAGDLVEHTADLGAAATNPSSFGVDAAGEVYLVSYAGSVYRLVGTAAPSDPGARRRPPDVEPIGFAVPRGSAGATSATADSSAPATPSGVTGQGVSAPRGCRAATAELVDWLSRGAAGPGDGWLLLQTVDAAGRRVSAVVWLRVTGDEIILTPLAGDFAAVMRSWPFEGC